MGEGPLDSPGYRDRELGQYLDGALTLEAAVEKESTASPAATHAFADDPAHLVGLGQAVARISVSRQSARCRGDAIYQDGRRGQRLRLH